LAEKLVKTARVGGAVRGVGDAEQRFCRMSRDVERASLHRSERRLSQRFEVASETAPAG